MNELPPLPPLRGLFSMRDESWPTRLFFYACYLGLLLCFAVGTWQSFGSGFQTPLAAWQEWRVNKHAYLECIKTHPEGWCEEHPGEK